MKPVFTQSLPTTTLSFDMIPVKGGSFRMGDEHGGLWEVCRPVHEVKVSDFQLAQYPVTQALWIAVMGNNPSRFQGEKRPVELVTWDDAQAFLQKLNELTDQAQGAGYRLPSEAEWEYAARGGMYSKGYRYAGSDKLKEVGWYGENSHRETKPVGLKFPNELGLYDMSGNVREWCEDDWHDNYWGAPENGSAWVDVSKRGANRVYRGGAYFGSLGDCRPSSRDGDLPWDSYDDLGFRLALPSGSGSPARYR